MPILAINLQITRTELGLGNLELEDPANGYQVVSFGPGATSWRRDTVNSPYVHGSTLINAVMDLQIAPLVVRVKGVTATQKESRLGVLIDALSQFLYGIGSIIDGVSYVWICQPADYSIGDGGEFNKFHEKNLMTEVVFMIPRNPVPYQGVL
jgi:hypothetical protein